MSKVTFSCLKPYLSPGTLSAFEAYQQATDHQTEDEAFFAFFDGLEIVVCAFGVAAVGAVVSEVHDDISGAFWWLLRQMPA